MAKDKTINEESEFDDQTNDDNIASEEIPKEERKLQTQAYDKSISDLYAKLTNKDIILDPDYQRYYNYIWDNKKASLLIESILLNVPIPVIYVAEDVKGRWIVVDGLQRLNSLRRFMDNEFKLTGLDVLSELNRQQFSTLNPKAQRLLKNGMIRTIVILSESHPEIKYDIFMRLNRGSIKLNEQELRNCLYRGPFIRLLKKLTKNTSYLECLGFVEPHKRFYDAELVLRFLALHKAFDPETGTVKDYPNRMRTFLNKYMELKKNIAPDEAQSLESLFTNTVEKVSFMFEKPAFRRINPVEGTTDKPLNRALMDVAMVGLSYVSHERLKSIKNELLKLYTNLPQTDTKFNEAILYATSDKSKLEYRLSTWYKEMMKIVTI
ncbi:MAG: DUF262 domain-containing protein [Nitrospirae bacterium]|nr:DUF262 domain-containing protein [Nitrospirota bacterium]